MRYLFNKWMLLLASVLFFSVWYISLVVSEFLYFGKNSINYYLLLSSEIRNAPLFGSPQDIIYYYSSGDGVSPHRNSVMYDSSLNQDFVINDYIKYYKENGFRFIKKENYILFQSGYDNFLLKVDGNQGKTIVTLEQVE